MPTFAHIENGQAFDPQEAESSEVYLKRFHPNVTADWIFVQVPDRSQHNDTLIVIDEICTNPTLVARDAAAEAARLAAEEAARLAEESENP